jgi:hypothetical protein
VNVVLSSGACGASVSGAAVNVSCGLVTSAPLLPPASGVAGSSQQAFVGGTLGAAPLPFMGGAYVDGGASDYGGASGNGGASDNGSGGEQRQPDTPTAQSPPQPLAWGGEPAAPDAPALRQVGVLPAWATGNSPMAVYSGGANLSSWRVVSNDNAQRVELTISW